MVPGTPVHAGRLGGDAARHLVAHDLDGLGRRADEGHAPLGDGPGEVGVLGEEAVAGVHAVGARLLDDLEDPLGVEVALGRGLAAEGVGLVGQADVQRVAVELGVHGHRGDAQLLAGADDPDGDLAPVGDEDLGEHAIWLRGVPGGRARSALAERSRAPVRGRPLGRRDGLDQRRRDGAGPRRRAGGDRRSSPTTRPPAGAGGAAPGRPRRGPSLLTSILLRPPAAVVDLCTMAVARRRRRRRSRRWPGSRPGSSGRTTSCGRATARRPTASWPGSWPRPTGRPARRRRLSTAGRRAIGVVVGIGINVNWPAELPDELADLAVACNHVTGTARSTARTCSSPSCSRLDALLRAARRHGRPRAAAGRLAGAVGHARPPGPGRPRRRGRRGHRRRRHRRRPPRRRAARGRAPDGRRRRRHPPPPSVAAAGTVDPMSDARYS